MKGVIVPVATPLAPDERPDLEALDRLVETLLAARVHALFANGSMGGFAFHTNADQLRVIRHVSQTVNGRTPVLAGVADTSVSRVLERIHALAGLPLAAVVLLPPYYFIYSQDELIRFFTGIADRSPFPVVLYNNPRLVPSNHLTPAAVATLSRHGNIIGLKNSAPDDWQQLFDADIDRSRFALICGAEKRMGDGLRAGYDGLTGGFHNIFPETAVALYEAAVAHDWSLVDQLQTKLNRAYRIFEIAGGWRGLEVALQWMGVASKATVHPFDNPISPEIRAEIESILVAEKQECPRCCTK